MQVLNSHRHLGQTLASLPPHASFVHPVHSPRVRQQPTTTLHLSSQLLPAGGCRRPHVVSQAEAHSSRQTPHKHSVTLTLPDGKEVRFSPCLPCPLHAPNPQAGPCPDHTGDWRNRATGQRCNYGTKWGNGMSPIHGCWVWL